MPLPALVGGAVLAATIVPMVVKVLLGLGVGIASYAGISSLLDAAQSAIQSNLSGLPADALAIIGISKIDVYVTLVFSAYAIRLTLKGLDSTGVLRKFSLGAMPT